MNKYLICLHSTNHWAVCYPSPVCCVIVLAALLGEHGGLRTNKDGWQGGVRVRSPVQLALQLSFSLSPNNHFVCWISPSSHLSWNFSCEGWWSRHTTLFIAMVHGAQTMCIKRSLSVHKVLTRIKSADNSPPLLPSTSSVCFLIFSPAWYNYVTGSGMMRLWLSRKSLWKRWRLKSVKQHWTRWKYWIC